MSILRWRFAAGQARRIKAGILYPDDNRWAYFRRNLCQDAAGIGQPPKPTRFFPDGGFTAAVNRFVDRV
jgi:hypothetical protein